jgi:predicted metal-dependent enzyme (double-stranded beta helix superfamily)
MTQLLRSPAATLTSRELVRLVERIAGTPSLWRPQVRRPDNERWWARLRGDSQLDVWLLTWLPGQSTDLHDHGSSAAAFTVVTGRLAEVRAVESGARSTVTRSAGTTARIDPGVIHDVRAVAGSPAVSIHAYSPPLSAMTYWTPGDDGRLRPDRTIASREPDQISA